ARLLFAEGRSLHRQERIDEACALFEKSAALAAVVGPDGYETRGLAMGLAAWGYAMRPRVTGAETQFAAIGSLGGERGDMHNLVMSLNNRCILSLMSKKTERLLADFRRVISITRESGFPVLECLSTKDLGEVYYLIGQLDDAEAQVGRAIDVNRKVLGE